MGTRPFRGWDDLAAMQAVCSARLLATPGRSAAHPGDIAWWVGWPPRTTELLADMFLLWEEGRDVVGFASYMPDEGDLSVFVTPEYSETDKAFAFEDEAEAWASRGQVPLRWIEFEDETAAVERWRARGYAQEEGGYMNLVRPLDDIHLGAPADDRVRPVGEDDVEGRAAVTHAAFGSSLALADYVAEYRGFRASPAYPHGSDLLLRDTDGRPAACCIAWADPVSRAGTLEPVATHPSMHRRGFGKALLLEAFRRLAVAGVYYVIVGVDLDNPAADTLYRSVGFRPDRVLRIYRRP